MTSFKRKDRKSHYISTDFDDERLFEKYCEDVKPLKKRDQGLKKTLPNIKNQSHHYNQQKQTDHYSLTQNPYTEIVTPIDPEATLYYVKVGIQHKLIRQMKQGKIKIEAVLDLHGCTANEAVEALSNFIRTSQAEGKKWVLIVHGKGNYSPKKYPVLKSLLNEWLKEQTAVLAFHSAQPKDGGKGALYLLLKSTRSQDDK